MSLEEFYSEKIIPPQLLPSFREKIRKEGKRLTTLNGSFDLLHAGHLYIIHEAKKQGHVLLIALNSDASIQQYKGADRPIIPLKERMQMLCALSFVDYVTWFEETDPCKLLTILKPDVHVNGEEYGSDCIEAQTVKENGGTLHLVKRIPGLATSQIIDKIKNICV
jgi:D-glycero-beta-D-manno-heptose 1-phosphate adenylyltransferase